MHTPIIIPNACHAGHIDNILGRKHIGPFAWWFLAPQDMITLYENFDDIDFRNIEFMEYKDWKATNPNPQYHWMFDNNVKTEDDRIVVVVDSKVQIVYPHHNKNDKEQFIESWHRRLDRYYACPDKKHYFLYQTYKGEPRNILDRFLVLPYDKILIDSYNPDVTPDDKLYIFRANTIYDIYSANASPNSAYNRSFTEFVRSL